MKDLATRIRDTLHRHEADAPSFDPSDARRTIVRTRRRQVLNVTAFGIGTVAVVIGLVAGAGQVIRAGQEHNVLHRPPSVVSPTPNEAGKPYRVLHGRVTFAAAPPWDVGFAGPWALWFDSNYEERVVVLTDPVQIEAGCRPGPAPADAETLVQSIRSDPDLEVTRPVAVAVGGVQALRMDVAAAAGARICATWEGPGVVREQGSYSPQDDGGTSDSTVVVGSGRHRMRLYVLDIPGGSSHILAIAIVAPEATFQQVVRAAAPIVDSFQFHAA
jgi:hypothetical protein